MHHSPVMKAAAIVSVVFGLALLLAPNALVALYNAQPMSGPGLYNSSLYGGLLIGFGIINWMASEGTWHQVRPVVVGSIAVNVLCLSAALYRQLADATIPPAAWINVVIFAVFAALFAWVYAREMQKPMPHAAQPG
jgi:preprotein translocase subunit SecY